MRSRDDIVQPLALIHSERAALADELASVPESAWNTPSLCEGWTVHQALGHMVATAKMTPPRFIVKLASSGFRFNAMAAKGIAGETAGTPVDTLAEFRARSRLDRTARAGRLLARRDHRPRHRYPLATWSLT
jgi:uncharacterized protein (TIGR03083 family)